MEEGFEFAKGFVGLALTELQSLRGNIRETNEIRFRILVSILPVYIIRWLLFYPLCDAF